MWRAPFRANTDVSQTFSDGVVKIFAEKDVAEPGYQPKTKLLPVATLRYEEQRLGVQRYYAAAQNQIKIARVLRVPRTGLLSTQDVAETEDGKMYRIDLIQAVKDCYPPSDDITLVAYTQMSESDKQGSEP